ncbi:hypothetical protein Salat_2680600 [Sesamum alatum]|uniref:Uncharacterized protein n=1 Tax=Sesamum alatum TaxID=300844 RepID=A0AAE1XPK4_9LAMI|nr:hypothetical protein Salat_2680600 [Sesamum alatum]
MKRHEWQFRKRRGIKGSLVHLIQATRGMVVHKVSESHFCLVFNHQEDLGQERKVLFGSPTNGFLTFVTSVAAGPSRHLGVMSATIRLTCVWNPSSQSQYPSDSRRGAHAFGAFSSASGGAERGSPEIGGASPS